MKRLFFYARVMLFLLAAGLILFALFRWKGLLLFPQEAAPRSWQVFGVDVSSYQGEVEWSVLADQAVFPFRALEGLRGKRGLH